MERERSQECTLCDLLATFLCAHYVDESFKSFLQHDMPYSVKSSLCCAIAVLLLFRHHESNADLWYLTCCSSRQDIRAPKCPVPTPSSAHRRLNLSHCCIILVGLKDGKKEPPPSSTPEQLLYVNNSLVHAQEIGTKAGVHSPGVGFDSKKIIEIEVVSIESDVSINALMNVLFGGNSGLSTKNMKQAI